MTTIQSSNVPQYLNDQTAFSQSLTSLASAEELAERQRRAAVANFAIPDSKTAVNEEGAETVASASPLVNTKERLTKITSATRRNRKGETNDSNQQLIKNAALAALTTVGGLGALFLGYRKLNPAKVTPITPDPSLLTDEHTKKITETIIDTATGTVNDILNKNPIPPETPLTTASSSVISTALIVCGVAIAALIVIGTGVYFVARRHIREEAVRILHNFGGNKYDHKWDYRKEENTRQLLNLLPFDDVADFVKKIKENDKKFSQVLGRLKEGNNEIRIREVVTNELKRHNIADPLIKRALSAFPNELIE